DFEVAFQDLTPHSGALAVSASHAGLERGVWDVFVVVRFPEEEKEIRVGAERARSIEPEGTSNLSEDPEPHERVLAYFTKVSGNLALDCGTVLHRNLGAARVVGLTLDENSRAVLLVRTPRGAGADRRVLRTPRGHLASCGTAPPSHGAFGGSAHWPAAS